MSNELTQALNKYMDKVRPRDSVLGTILSMTPGNNARVILTDGTTVKINVPFAVSEGDRIVCVRPIGSPVWITTGVAQIRRVGGSPSSSDGNDSIGITRMPSGFRVIEMENIIIFRWSGWPDFIGGYEVQVSEVDDHNDAHTAAVTMGCTFITEQYTAVYARVRAVSNSFIKSAWSQWIHGRKIPKEELQLPYPPIEWNVTGALVALDGVGGYKYLPVTTRPAGVKLTCDVLGNSGSTEIDIKGTNDLSGSWETLLSTRPTLAYNDTTLVADGVVGLGGFREGMWLRLDIVDVADGARGLNVVIYDYRTMPVNLLTLTGVGYES